MPTAKREGLEHEPLIACRSQLQEADLMKQ